MENRIELIDSKKKFYQKKKEWTDFEKLVSGLQITNTFDYLFSFWDNFELVNSHDLGQSRVLTIIFYYKNNTLKAIFPFCKITRNRKKIFKVSTIEFIGQQFFTNYLDIISDGLDIDDNSFVKKWIKSNLKYDLIHLSHLPEFSENINSFYKNNIYSYNHSSELMIDSAITYEEYKFKVHSKNYRLNLNNLYNRLKRAEIKFEVLIKEFETSDLSELLRLSEFKLETGKKNIYSFKNNLEFLENIYKSYNAKVIFISFDGKNICFGVMLSHRDCFFLYDMSFDRQYNKFWPGTLLFDFVLRNNIADSRYRTIFGWGMDFHKYQFCNKFYKLYNHLDSGNTLTGKFWYNLKKKSLINSSVFFEAKSAEYLK